LFSYDEKQPDSTAGKQKFSTKIQQMCCSPEIYHLYKKDRREILDQSYFKSKEYREKKREQLELTLLQMKVLLYGDENISMKDLRKLAEAGIHHSKRLHDPKEREALKAFEALETELQQLALGQSP
jgi:hypothetical protein